MSSLSGVVLHSEAYMSIISIRLYIQIFMLTLPRFIREYYRNLGINFLPRNFLTKVFV